MNDIDATKLVLERVDACPYCSAKMIQKTEHRLICPTCGLHIFLETQTYRHWIWGFMGAITIFALGMLTELLFRLSVHG